MPSKIVILIFRWMIFVTEFILASWDAGEDLKRDLIHSLKDVRDEMPPEIQKEVMNDNKG